MAPAGSAAQPKTEAPLISRRVDGARALQYTRDVVSFGPRHTSTEGYAELHNYLRANLKSNRLEEVAFTAKTPIGPLPMRNFVVKFPGKKDGIIVIAGHYDTVRIPGFVGANDAGSSTGLLLELANALRGPARDGYSVWLVWFDGEEAIKEWTETDSTYGSRHQAQLWSRDGTIPKIKAFFLVDMIGDADLNIDRDFNSDAKLTQLVARAAARLGYSRHFFRRETAINDDHIPFVRLGVPAIDLIDYNYGPNNSYWHTAQDTPDKLSARSFEIVGNTVMEALAELDRGGPNPPAHTAK